MGDIDIDSLIPTIVRKLEFLMRDKNYPRPETMFLRDDGWTKESDTWVYVSAASFKITGKDTTAKFPIGTKLRCKQGGAYKYFYVVSAAFGADTTVTITGGIDYTLAVGAITDAFYSYALGPQGFPHRFNWTPTLDGFSADPTNCIYRFFIEGRSCTVEIFQATNGTSDDTIFTITPPVTARTLANATWGSTGWYAVDNGAAISTPTRATIVSGGTVINLYKDVAGAAWTNANGKRAYFSLTYDI